MAQKAVCQKEDKRRNANRSTFILNVPLAQRKKAKSELDKAENKFDNPRQEMQNDLSYTDLSKQW